MPNCSELEFEFSIRIIPSSDSFGLTRIKNTTNESDLGFIRFASDGKVGLDLFGLIFKLVLSNKMQKSFWNCC